MEPIRGMFVLHSDTNPDILRQSQGSLDQFSWYSSLYQYSRPLSDSERGDETELGPDGDIVSAMISTAVAPRLCKLLEAGALDPYSAKNIRRMIDFTEQVEASIGTESNKFQVMCYPY